MAIQVARIGAPPAGLSLVSGALAQSAGQIRIGVPDVLGLARDDAVQQLANLGLKVRIVEVLAYGAEGTVFKQTPAARTDQAPGAEVMLELVVNPPVPIDVAARFDTIDGALAALTKAEASTRGAVDDLATAAANIQTTTEKVLVAVNALSKGTGSSSSGKLP